MTTLPPPGRYLCDCGYTGELRADGTFALDSGRVLSGEEVAEHAPFTPEPPAPRIETAAEGLLWAAERQAEYSRARHATAVA